MNRNNFKSLLFSTLAIIQLSTPLEYALAASATLKLCNEELPQATGVEFRGHTLILDATAAFNGSDITSELKLGSDGRTLETRKKLSKGDCLDLTLVNAS
jgi:hypothetical protein